MCMCEYGFMHMSAGPSKGRKEDQIPWSLSYWNWTCIFCKSSMGSLNQWTTSIAPVFRILKIIWLHFKPGFISACISMICPSYWKWLWKVEIRVRYNKAREFFSIGSYLTSLVQSVLSTIIASQFFTTLLVAGFHMMMK